MISASLIRLWFENYRVGVEKSAGELNSLDAALGDGDFGASMTRGLEAVKKALASPEKSVGVLLETAGSTIVSSIGGTSGPLVGSLFLHAGMTLGSDEQCRPGDFAGALRIGCNAVMALGGAEVGDKTMIDALVPAIEVLVSSTWRGEDFGKSTESAAREAADAAAATADLRARRGRASYTATGGQGHVDPGAQGIAILFEALAEAVRQDAGPSNVNDSNRANAAEAAEPASNSPLSH